MENQMKEILDYLKDFIKENRLEQINLNRYRINQILDCITNLQEENNYLKFMNCSLSREIELKKEVIELLQNN